MMDEKKVREAIEYLQRQICTLDVQKEYDEYGRPLYNETLDMAIKLYETAIEALEKQLPKKPRTSKAYYGCPDCTTIRSLRQKHNYCHDCGQRLDWSE